MYNFIFLGETWKIHRKLLNPSFQYNVINSFMNIFNENGKRLLKRLYQMKDDEVFDAFEVLTTYSMNMICGKIFFFFLNINVIYIYKVNTFDNI